MNRQAAIKVDVLVEHHEENGYAAHALAWPDCVVEATTREDALTAIRAAILEHLEKAEIVTLEIKPEELVNSLQKFAGVWANDSDFDEFLREIERYRREIDAELSPWVLKPEANQEVATV
jgi:predicted RNase H-like HicB family nuclease